MHLPTLTEIKNLFSNRSEEIKTKIKEVQDIISKNQAFLAVLQGMISESNAQAAKVEELVKAAESAQAPSADAIPTENLADTVVS